MQAGGEDRDFNKNLRAGLERYAVVLELLEAGYQVQAICQMVGVSRSSLYRRRRRQAGAGFPDHKYLGSRDPAGDAQIVDRIKEIKQKHPFWGYRGVRVWLKHREGLPVGYNEDLSSHAGKRPFGAAEKIPGQTATRGP